MGKKILILVIIIAIIVGGYFYYANFMADSAHFIEKSREKFNITDYANETQINEYKAYLLKEQGSKSDEISKAIDIETGYWEYYLVNKNTMKYIADTPNLATISCGTEAQQLKTLTDNGKLKLKALKADLEANKENLKNYYELMQEPIENLENDLINHNDILYILCPD
ncbi:MAG: hypothetical protein PHH82_03575 [Candidatus ainarchaeum sp.]|nr:hypothetical protein [Candidatus ainarchaeum sp.]